MTGPFSIATKGIPFIHGRVWPIPIMAVVGWQVGKLYNNIITSPWTLRRLEENPVRRAKRPFAPSTTSHLTWPPEPEELDREFDLAIKDRM